MSYLTLAAKVFAAFFIPFIIMTLAIASLHGSISVPGVIALPGYAHAVVVCGEATTINAGHEADVEVQELLALAAEMCPTFTAH